MIANRRRPGTTSRKSSSRLPARSVVCIDRPVTLPPGRTKLATRPLPTGSPAAAKTIGITDVACFAATTFAGVDVTMTPTLSRTNSAAIWAERSLRPSAHAILDRDGATFDPTEFAQPLRESGDPLTVG
jgi:hypothetical protein